MSPRTLSALRSLVQATMALFSLLAFGAASAQAGLPEAVQRVKPSVLSVGTYQKTRSPAFVFRATGFAVGDGTLIATNAHVVPDTLKAEDGEALAVMIQLRGAQNPVVRGAKVVMLDKEHDLALLRIPGPPLPAVTLGDSDAVREGQSIAITGFPIGQVLGFNAVTHRGIVASLAPAVLPTANASQLDPAAARQLKNAPITLFQLDATTYAGHSGSPVYDEGSGEVIGILNMGFMRGAKDPIAGQASSISFAVPSRFLRDLLGKTPP